MAPGHRPVVWSEGARRELNAAIAHFADDAPNAARQLLERLLDAAASLDQQSERGRIVPERGDPRVRELLIAPFRLLYRVGSDDVVILALIHQRQAFEQARGDGGDI